jgi:hypothetical protein
MNVVVLIFFGKDSKKNILEHFANEKMGFINDHGW